MKVPQATADALRIAAAAGGMRSRPSKPATELRFMSWNLRYDSRPDHIPVSATIASLPAQLPDDEAVKYYATSFEAPWSTRRIGIAQEILFTAPLILGVQEALHRQILDLCELLPGYAYIGVGRDDGKQAGEYEAIFYRKDAVELIEWDTFWLSDTPEVPSKYPGAGSVRTATRGKFVYDGKPITVICTHWDDQSDKQRQLAASLIRYRGAYEVATAAAPVFVLGDFNSPSSGTDSGGYDIMTGDLPLVPINVKFEEKYYSGEDDSFAFKDVAQETAPLGRSGHLATFTGFKNRMDSTDLKRIDFVMAGGEGWKADKYRVGENWFDTGVVLSDHRPVWADVVLS